MFVPCLWTKYESNFWLYNRTRVAIVVYCSMEVPFTTESERYFVPAETATTKMTMTQKLGLASKHVHSSEHWIWGILIKCIRSFGDNWMNVGYSSAHDTAFIGPFTAQYVFVLMNYFQPMNHHHSHHHSKWPYSQRQRINSWLAFPTQNFCYSNHNNNNSTNNNLIVIKRNDFFARTKYKPNHCGMCSTTAKDF